MLGFGNLIQKTRDILSREQNDILKTSFYLMIVITITKITGFIYSAIIGSRLGASRESDLFILANTIPEIIGNLILIGVMSAVFIPILIKARQERGEESFLKLFSTLLNFSLLCFILLALIMAFGADYFYPFLLGNIINSVDSYTASEIDEMVQMMRLLLIPQIILGVSTFYSSSLNVHQRFIIPQLAPLFYNFGRIFGAYFLIPILGGAEGLVWGTILGSILHLLIQLPLVSKLNINHSWVLDFKDAYFLKSLRVGLPRIVGLGAEYIAMGVDKFIAARFVIGSVTTFNFAIQLISIPLSLFGVTFSTASFPTLSKFYIQGEHVKFRELLTMLINQIIFLAIPTTVILLILRVSLVRLLFGIFGGAFDFEDTYLTAWIVAFFAMGLVFESIRTLLYRGFYAANDTLRPLYCAVFTLIGGIFSGILLTNYFSHFDSLIFSELTWNPEYFASYTNGRAAVGGLALSSSIVYTVESLILIAMLNKYIVKLDIKGLLRSLGKKILAGVIMACGMFLVFKTWGDSPLQTKTVTLILLVSLTTFAGIFVYIIVSFALKIPETNIFLKFLTRILPKQFESRIKNLYFVNDLGTTTS